MIRGGYIAWIDADDFIELNYIENMVRHLKEYDADMAIDFYGSTNENVDKVFTSKDNEILKEYMLMNLSNMLWPTLTKSDLYVGEEFRDFVIGEDNDMLCRIYEKCKKIVRFQSKGYHYRIIEGSVVHSSSADKYNKWLDASLVQIEYLENKYQDLIPVCAFQRVYIASLIQHSSTKLLGDDKKRLNRRLKTIIRKAILKVPLLSLNRGQIKEIVSALLFIIGC